MMTTNPYASGDNKRAQNWFDKTFIKLRDLSISYEIPQSVCQKIGMKGASVGFVGQNLLMWAKEFNESKEHGKRNNSHHQQQTKNADCS